MKQTIPIMGMHCASCATLIARQLKKTKGVQRADVNYGSEEAVVDVDSKNDITTVIQTITSLGYKPIISDDAVVSEEKKEEAHIHTVQRMGKVVFINGMLTFLVVLFTLPDMLGFPIPSNLKEPLIYASTLLATIVQIYGGWGFYQGALSALRVGATNMDTLIVLGTTIAYGYSVFHFIATLLGQAEGLPQAMFYDSSTVIITLVLLGKYLEAKGKHSATESIRALSKLESITSHKLIGNNIVETKTENIILGDLLEIRPGERIPVDGIIVSGASSIDQSLLTGEPIPMEKHIGDELIAGTINTTGVLRMKASAVGKDTMLSHIQQLVRDAQNAKPEIARLADSISSVFVPIVIILGVGTAIFWLIMGSPVDAIAKSIAVFVVACPCALGLATPMAVIGGVGRAAKAGVLIRSAHALERAGNTTTVVFDKTGTITKGKPVVTDTVIIDTSVLPTLFAVEAASEHPLSTALLTWATANKINHDKTTPQQITAIPGLGISAVTHNKHIFIGTEQFLQSHAVRIDKNIQQKLSEFRNSGKTIVLAAYDTKLVALFAIDDELRPEVSHVIGTLKSMHITPILLSGDKKESAKIKANMVGIEKVIGGVKPDEKAGIIEKLRGNNQIIMMIGDGINDAPAIAASDVGVAIGSGTAIAKATADMTILSDSLNRIPFMIHVSKRVMQTIRQNLLWAFGYNIILIPIAMGVGASFGVTLTPPMAAFAMAASSLSVVLNSSRLSRIKIEAPYEIETLKSRRGGILYAMA
ncbi:MAG: heavy metal translocating P-type ATPase [Microgenomates group bacterium]